MKLTQTLLEWVVTSAVLILVVLTLRALLGKRVSARLRYALWAVVLVRLLVPVQLFHLPFAGTVVFPETQIEETLPPVETSASGQSVGSPTIAAPASDGVAADHGALTEPNAPAVPSAPKALWLGWVWLVGSAAVAVVLLACNLRFSRKLCRVRTPLDGVDCPLPVYITGGLPSPCLFGLIHPAVYVTPEVSDDPGILRHVLAHEYTHFHHGDHIWNILRSIALAVHWWNPLVWLAMILSRRDCELACDEGALKRLGDGERLAYGRTLLALLTVKPWAGGLLTCATTMTSRQKSVFDRVTRIARTPRRWLWAAVVAVIATALACVCAFGQAVEEPKDEPRSDTTESQAVPESPAPDNRPQDTDLNRNGVTETVYTEPITAEDGESEMGQRVTVWEDDKQIFSDEGHYAHAGYNAVFLCTLDGEDYLLRYNPYMQQGWCDYSYKLFTLTQDGEEQTVRENSLEFSINIASPLVFGGPYDGSFDPEKIAAFTDEINGLLAHSVQLINTDEELLATFEREGRLYDSLNWLDFWEPVFVRDESKSLLENLQAFQTAMEGQTALGLNLYLAVIQGNEPLYSPEYGARMTLDEFCAQVGPGYDNASIWDFTVLDLDGDGAQEIVLNLDRTYRQWCVVLHEQGGEVRGYALYIRWLNTYTLKEDGAFDWSSSAFENGWGRLCFTADGYETEKAIWHMDTTYYLGDQTVSQADYDAAYNRQEAVPDAVWYEFTPENLAAAFPA